MAKIKPFKAIIYNPQKIKDISSVVCPPYDVISDQAQERYHGNNPYNLIHILLGKDTPGEDKYRRAGNYFKDWLKDRILIQDDRPAIYFYSQQYNLRGEKRTRLGLISLLHLGDKDSAAFAHENTRLGPKEDRARLLKQVKANLSPIFVVFMDKKRIIQRIHQRHIQGKTPFIDVTDQDKTIHKLWRLDSPEMLSSIQASMSGEKIFIADGHHRYEVACAYRDEMRQKLGDSVTGEENFNYILSYFTNTTSRGLSILPIHRLLKLEAKLDLEDFIAKLKDYFDVEEIKEKERFFFLMEKGGRTEHVLGVYKDKRYWLLRLRNIKILDKMISDKPKVYRSLDVAILNTIVFKKTLGLDLEAKDNIEFGSGADGFIKEADNNPLYIAFFLNPVQIQQIISVALNGERMPPKSTYFYPKVLSGLVINRHSD
ncbi:MAG: DUF1015 domain-containing protein [Candidatus Omnitrophica bacterium]|nr:DUF1015 domain-containing protein [Candidatus Omnitrophota bacterium]